MADEIKFYTDSHIPRSVAVQLRRREVDIIRCQDVGMENVDDLVHLEYASNEKRTILTCDQGFFFRWHNEWLEQGKSHAGIIIVRSDYQNNIGVMVKELFQLHQLVVGGAADLEKDIFNLVHRIP